MREEMVRDIKSVGKELAIDIVALNKKIDSRSNAHLERMKYWESAHKKLESKLHKVMKQYNTISHHLRKLEGGFATVERKLELTNGG